MVASPTFCFHVIIFTWFSFQFKMLCNKVNSVNTIEIASHAKLHMLLCSGTRALARREFEDPVLITVSEHHSQSTYTTRLDGLILVPIHLTFDMSCLCCSIPMLLTLLHSHPVNGNYMIEHVIVWVRWEYWGTNVTNVWCHVTSRTSQN